MTFAVPCRIRTSKKAKVFTDVCQPRETCDEAVPQRLGGAGRPPALRYRSSGAAAGPRGVHCVQLRGRISTAVSTAVPAAAAGAPHPKQLVAI